MIRIEFSLSDIDRAASEFLRLTADRKHFAFYGAMGAGKTTFIKALCKALGVKSVVTSPTFALVNEYDAGDNGLVYHFDFYRLNKPEEAFDFGCEEYFASGHYCFAEWPEKAEQALPNNICRVKIAETENGKREIVVVNADVL